MTAILKNTCECVNVSFSPVHFTVSAECFPKGKAVDDVL